MRLVFLTMFSLFCCSGAWAGPIAREAGAIYLADFTKQLPRVKLNAAAPCYFDADMRRYAGTLRFPQSVQLDAVSSDGKLRVRGHARQGGVAAWIDPGFIEGMPADFVDNLRRAEERRRKVDELIARKEVAMGMTSDEVMRSLGKPQKRTSKVGPDGSRQTYEYIKYDLIPQTSYTPSYAQTITTSTVQPEPGKKVETVVVRSSSGYNAATVYVKVSVGTMTITFDEGVVESIEQTEGTLVRAKAAIVAPPINVFW
jgi:hypothetical protein